MTSLPIARISEVQTGTMIGREANGQKVLVANVGGEYFAMRAVCNHTGGLLYKGKLDANIVTCLMHGSKWDVKTGRLMRFSRQLPPEPVYKISVVGDQIFVEI